MGLLRSQGPPTFTAALTPPTLSSPRSLTLPVSSHPTVLPILALPIATLPPRILLTLLTLVTLVLLAALDNAPRLFRRRLRELLTPAVHQVCDGDHDTDAQQRRHNGDERDYPRG